MVDSSERNRELPRIVESIQIKAPGERVWEIISDLDNEPKYWWGTRSVRNIGKDGNIIDREIYQKFGNKPIRQKVTLKPKTEIEVDYLEGITLGTKALRLTSLDEIRQEVTVEWNIHFSGLYGLISPIVASHVRKGTREAMIRIKNASEGRELAEGLAEKSQA
jgi:hypothetical protein